MNVPVGHVLVRLCKAGRGTASTTFWSPIEDFASVFAAPLLALNHGCLDARGPGQGDFI